MKSGVMQKIGFLTFLFSVYAITSYSKMGHHTSFSDTIEIRKKAGGYQFYQADGQLNMKQLQKIMKTNEQAYKKLRSGRSSNTMATILGYTGGFLIGWPLGTAIGGGDPNWTMAGIGAGLAAVSIPLS